MRYGRQTEILIGTVFFLPKEEATSGYGTSRDVQYEARLATDIQNFISQYGANTSADRRTIFLFPGGLGSQLVRADVAYPNTPTPYTLSWIDCGS